MKNARIILSLTLILTLATFTLGCASSTNSPSEETPAKTQTTRGALHTFTSDANGFDTHTYYYDSGEEVVVLDAQFTPQLAEQMLADIRQQTDSPITHVVVTHPNPDKFNGASVFQREGAKLVASKATAEAMPNVHAYKKYYFVQVAGMFTEDTYPSLPTPDVTFEDELVLELKGGKNISLKVLEHAGVSTTQTVAYIEDVEALIVGDLVHHGVHAWLEGGIAGEAPDLDIDAWKLALDELLSYKSATVHAGRGEVASVEDAVAAQKSYLEQVQTLSDAYKGKNEAPYDAEDHAALAGEIKAAFPDRGLGYLVDYSAYGLFVGE
jgi:glyoxylase-like metal-dependent hydrolase (beta-lactamase superfamily II)